MSKIINTKIVHPDDFLFGGPSKVFAKFEGSSEFEHLFDFYSDEINFSRSELFGLTRREAHALYHAKDVAYLKS